MVYNRPNASVRSRFKSIATGVRLRNIRRKSAARRIQTAFRRRKFKRFGSFGRVVRRSIDQGNCSLKRETYSTCIYNSGTVDDGCRWVNGDPGLGASNMPPYWNLWDNSLGIGYVASNSLVSCATEVGGAAGGAAGAVIRGRIRVCHNDVTLPDELKLWEYIRLDYVKLTFTYLRTEYTAGNDASGITPTLEYFVDTDGSYSAGTTLPEQDTVVEMCRRPNLRRVKLTPNVPRSMIVKPKAFQVIAPDPQMAWAVGKMVSVGFIDPNTGNMFQTPLSNMQFQIRNIQLPGSAEAATSCVKVTGTYYYTCKRFTGAAVN